MKYLSLFTVVLIACNHTTPIPSVRKDTAMRALDTSTKVSAVFTNDDIHIHTDSLNSFLRNVYHYDSTFGTIANASVAADESSFLFSFDGHEVKIEDVSRKDDDIVSTVIFDGKVFKTKFEKEGGELHAIDFRFPDSLTVTKFEVNKDTYYLIGEGSSPTASGKFTQIIYGILFDINKKTIYLLDTHGSMPSFYVKHTGPRLEYLFGWPYNAEDGELESDSLSLIVKQIN